MDDLHKFIQRNLRRILAVGALLISLVAISLLLNSAPGGSFWIATKAIPAGAKIEAQEVKLAKANLLEDEQHYFKGSEVVVGRFATRRLQPGDLIATTDIAARSSETMSTILPVGVGVDDLPFDLAIGDLVDIYVIPKESTLLPSLIARKIAIQSIDQKSRALGGSVAVSLATNTSNAALVVTAESQGRLVLARDTL